MPKPSSFEGNGFSAVADNPFGVVAVRPEAAPCYNLTAHFGLLGHSLKVNRRTHFRHPSSCAAWVLVTQFRERALPKLLCKRSILLRKPGCGVQGCCKI